MSTKHVPATPLDRAKARIDLLLLRLGQAKDTASPVPIEAANAEALYYLLAAAADYLAEVKTAR